MYLLAGTRRAFAHTHSNPTRFSHARPFFQHEDLLSLHHSSFPLEGHLLIKALKKQSEILFPQNSNCATPISCEDASVAILVELKKIICQDVSDSGCQTVGKRGGRKQKHTRQGQLSWKSRCLICGPTILAMVPPTIATPATILSFFIIFLLKNFALSGGVSAGSEEGEGDDPSDVKWCGGELVEQ
jgi:hypothetical protein